MSTPPAPIPADPSSPSSPSMPGPRAGRSGVLHRRVALFLADHPDTLFKVAEITAAIAAPSTGAVFEVGKRLAAAGHATWETGPHRFQITPDGIAAAGALPPPGPRNPNTTAGRRSTVQPVTRPGGQLYYPRRLAGGTDVEVLRRLRGQGIHALLAGPPGNGKTSLVEAAFTDAITLTGTSDTLAEDFTGSFLPQPDGTYQRAYGPLAAAMRDGRVLFIDDATLIPPRVLAVLYPAMDGRGVITIPAFGHERIHAADGFYVIAAHNPGVHGAILTEALASRFAVHIDVTLDADLARRCGVPPKIIDVALALNDAMRAGAIGWAPQMRELLTFTRVKDTLSLADAVANLAGRAPADDRDEILAVLRARFGAAVAPLSLGKQQ